MKANSIITHVAAALIISIVITFAYAAVQQTHRLAANDPQLQIARDMSTALHDQSTVDKWFRGDKIDISRSLSVFSTLYNDRGEPVMSTGTLNERMPTSPRGVFDFARSNGENVFTWQPRGGVRIAIVLRPLLSSPYSYVAVGRSLQETEMRTGSLRWMVLISWLLCMGVIILHWMMQVLPSKINRSGNL